MSRTEQRELDEAAATYDAAADNYVLTKDPRCLWGWGPPDCHHVWGHACFRALGHPGRCGEGWERTECPRRRPSNWDAIGRAEANR
jgi:hypothetical protein